MTDQSQGVTFSNDVEEAKHVEMRMWCVGQAVGLAVALTRAGAVETLDVMGCADEMYEFLTTGASRTHRRTTAKAN